MHTNLSLLAHRVQRSTFALDRERWLAAVLLVGVATLFALYVIVLEKDVHHAELLRAQAHALALAEADCELERSPDGRAACLARLQGEEPHALVATRAGQPENDVGRGGWRLTQASLRTAEAQ
jgi:hypothetical protein